MGDNDPLAGEFERHRARLRAVAYRMLGSISDSDDAVQEAWLRLSRTGGSAVDNLGAWLTTVVGRVSLDTLRAPRGLRRFVAARAGRDDRRLGLTRGRGPDRRLGRAGAARGARDAVTQ